MFWEAGWELWYFYLIRMMDILLAHLAFEFNKGWHLAFWNILNATYKSSPWRVNPRVQINKSTRLSLIYYSTVFQQCISNGYRERFFWVFNCLKIHIRYIFKSDGLIKQLINTTSVSVCGCSKTEVVSWPSHTDDSYFSSLFPTAQ